MRRGTELDTIWAFAEVRREHDVALPFAQANGSGDVPVDSSDESIHTHQMSKRLQVVMSDEEYQLVADSAKRRGIPIAEVVRDILRRTLPEDEARPAQERIAAVLAFARFAGPTGDIDEILREIETGRGVP